MRPDSTTLNVMSSPTIPDTFLVSPRKVGVEGKVAGATTNLTQVNLLFPPTQAISLQLDVVYDY